MYLGEQLVGDITVSVSRKACGGDKLGCGQISGGTRVLEMVAYSREATLEEGTRSMSTNAHEAAPALGKKLDTNVEENCCDLRGGKVWGRRPRYRLPPEKLCPDGFG
jgi:hypothetical protein